ncbi:hypothetical protein FRC10_000334 [Ceratobasidium sp. 414]|nr:hypothetical protein FRC10_000334 [Ceratobasidium sp. 414]
MRRTSSIKKKSQQQPELDLKLFQAQLAMYGMRINKAGVMVPIKHKTTKVANPPVMNDVQLNSNNDNHSDSNSNNDVEDNGDEDEDEDNRGEDGDSDGSDKGNNNKDNGEGDAVVHISGGVKVLLMCTKGIDMTRTITKQPKELINHVVRKALSLYPEFKMFCHGTLWPLKAFAHVILRTLSDQYRKHLGDGSGTKATKAKKVAKTSNTKKKKPIEDMEVENHPAMEDSSLGEVKQPLAVELPVEEELPFDEPPFEGGPASDGINNAEPPEADNVDNMDMSAVGHV